MMAEEDKLKEKFRQEVDTAWAWNARRIQPYTGPLGWIDIILWADAEINRLNAELAARGK